MTVASLSPLDERSLNKLADALAARHKAGPTRDKWTDRLVTWVIAVLLAWAMLQSDVAVLKSRVDSQDTLLREMRQDIKTILQRVR